MATHRTLDGVGREFDFIGVPVFLQIQQLLLELISRYAFPIHLRHHIGREYVVEVGAEQIDWARSQVDSRRWVREGDMRGCEEFRYFCG